MRGPDQGPVATAFRRRVRPGAEARYEDWLAGIARAAARRPGSQGTTILRPAGAGSEYVALTQFESAAALEAWLGSAERARWMSRLEAIGVCREDALTLAGMERWLALHPGPTGAPPRHRTAALILLGLYPLVLGLDVALGPSLSHLPRPIALLASLVVSVTAMVWCVLPWLTRTFHGWLHATPPARPPAARIDDTAASTSADGSLDPTATDRLRPRAAARR